MSNKSKRLRLVDEYKKIISELPFQTEDGDSFPVTAHYICPICLETFNLNELGDKANDLLTVEDVPPKSLGGNPLLITCRKCNSSCGHNLDVYLLNEIRYHDERMDFSKSKNTMLSCNGTSIRAKVTKDKHSGLKFDISRQNNNPQQVDEFIRKVQESGDSWKVNANISLSDYKRNLEAAEIAVLKSAYLLAFKKLGYRYILNTSLSPIRDQILNPDKDILKRAYIVGNEDKLPKGIPDGIFLATINSRKCIVVVLTFQLSQDKPKHRSAIALPMPDDEECLIYKNELCQNRKEEGNAHITILGPATVIEK